MKPTTEVEAEAKKRGISRATLLRAKKAVGVDRWKQPSANGAWYWRLPRTPHAGEETAAPRTDKPNSKVLTPEESQVSTFESSKMLTTNEREHLVGTTPLSANDVPWGDPEEIEDAQDAHLGMYRSEHLQPATNGRAKDFIEAEWVEVAEI